jgi:hypothetical protein
VSARLARAALCTEPFVHAIAMKIMPPRTRGERENSRIIFLVILPSRIELQAFPAHGGKIQAWFFVFPYVSMNIFFAAFFFVRLRAYVGTNFQPVHAPARSSESTTHFAGCGPRATASSRSAGPWASAPASCSGSLARTRGRCGLHGLRMTMEQQARSRRTAPPRIRGACWIVNSRRRRGVK